ncbi:YGGT family domain protein, putative [Babesia caballi]|uniref:YGGT family domain protein, putative n=1 Tax=Babesia caballi TaxID=5871 RepID=A0AAV4LZ93_BABCB|nr:YGGT family domain protein, putative [Babesia caballi]
MIVLLPLCVLLQAVCVRATLFKRARAVYPSFLAPASPAKQHFTIFGKCRRRDVQTRAAKDSRLPASCTPEPVPRAVPWERVLLQTWKDHGASIVLGAIYGIRIFRFVLHVRNLLEWLPQANPYLFPFDAVYQVTNTYLKLFQAVIPAVYGVDISGIVAFFVLDHLETLLAHKPGVAQEALR